MLDVIRKVIFPGSPVAFPSPERLGRAIPGARLLDVPTEDGLRLRAAWIPGAAGASDPVFVFFHGNGESAAENLDFGLALARRARADVVLAEYRGYGGMPGEPSEEGLYRDAAAVMATLAAERIDPARIVLVGRSLGTGVAVEMATRGHGTALVLVSPYTSILALGARIAGSLAPLLVHDRFDSLSKVARLTIPITVIHGTRDEIVPFAMGRELAEAARARLVPQTGRGHNDLVDLDRDVAEAVGR